MRRAADKLVPLSEWAQAQYAARAPSIYTLRRWCKAGRIFPAPEKHGRTYYVAQNARYVDDFNSTSFLGAIRDAAPPQ